MNWQIVPDTKGRSWINLVLGLLLLVSTVANMVFSPNGATVLGVIVAVLASVLVVTGFLGLVAARAREPRDEDR